MTKSPDSPLALVSYAHADGTDNADVLEHELRLRGIQVTRDVNDFRAGHPLGDQMAEAIGGDLVIGHLGPEALNSTAVLDQELGPALRAFARDGRPTVIVVPHGLGADRRTVDETIAGRLPVTLETTWAPSPDSTADTLTVETAAAVAGAAVKSLYPPGAGPSDGAWHLTLASRGDRRAAAGMLIDATWLVGGGRRTGSPEDWQRVANSIRDLLTALSAHGTRRQLTVAPFAHATGGFLLGRAFNRNAGWDITVTSPDGTCGHSPVRTLDAVRLVRSDGPFGDRQMAVAVDLAGRRLHDAVDRHFASQGGRPGRLVYFERTDNDTDMTTDEISAAARAIAIAIRDEVDTFQPERIDLFIAAPAAVPILLGAQMSTIDVPVGLWEFDGTNYVHTVDIDQAH